MWTKGGLIFAPNGNSWWMKSHASIPVPEKLGGNRYRVYFASRDDDNRSRVGFVEIGIREPTKILRISKEPVLDIGPLGSFDHYGVYPSSMVKHGRRRFLYYIGWDRGSEIWRAFIGLAVSDNKGQRFRKISRTPILDRSEEDPYLCTSPFVMREENVWKMWYTSGLTWEKLDGKPRPRYTIKYAESSDGRKWSRSDRVCLNFASDQEWAIARPSVVREGRGYRMWYSYAVGDAGYRLGYAESSDGVRWKRKDEDAAIGLSPTGWDSEMICYPLVILHNQKKYMFYNGNRFGSTGFGYALEV